MATPVEQGLKVEESVSHIEIQDVDPQNDVEQKGDSSIDPRVLKKLGRKIDFRVIPILSMVYSLSM
jgi:hypothetical protein